MTCFRLVFPDRIPIALMPLSNRVFVQRARPEHEHVLRQQPVATSDQVRFSPAPIMSSLGCTSNYERSVKFMDR